jgi:hypothetical protein
MQSLNCVSAGLQSENRQPFVALALRCLTTKSAPNDGCLQITVGGLDVHAAERAAVQSVLDYLVAAVFRVSDKSRPAALVKPAETSFNRGSCNRGSCIFGTRRQTTTAITPLPPPQSMGQNMGRQRVTFRKR